jgi:hypothetical protein
VKGYIHTAIALCACALLATPAFAKDSGTATASSARVMLKLDPSGEQRSFDSLSSAFYQLYQEYGAIGFYGTQVLDYSTYGKREKLIDAEHAYFLVNANKAMDAGSDFKVVAFASRKTAKAAQGKLGGELRDFEDTWNAVAKHWGVDLNPQPSKQVATGQQAEERREQRRVREPEPAQCFT